MPRRGRRWRGCIPTSASWCGGSADCRCATPGTIGGNIANGSPIGDMPPALIALGADADAAARRRAADDAAGGLLPSLWQAGPPARRVRRERARPAPRARHADPHRQAVASASTATSRRCAARSRSTVDGRHVTAARIAFGGMAATPRARAGLRGGADRRGRGARRPIEAAAAALAQDYHAARRRARLGRLSPRRPRPTCCGGCGCERSRRARCWRCCRWLSATAARRRRPAPRCRTTAPSRHVAGSARYVDDMPEPAGHAAPRLRPERARRMRGSWRIDLAAVRAAPGVVAVFTAADIPGAQRRQPGGAATTRCSPTARCSAPASRCSSSPRPAHRAARRAARLAAVDVRPAARARHDRRGARGRVADRGQPAHGARRCRRRARRRAAPPVGHASRSAGRSISTSKARSRSPRRASDGQIHVAQLDPAPERGPASDRQAARAQPRRRDGRGAPDGRRVRRQGDAGRAYAAAVRAGRREDRAPRQDPRRPRRRHGDDRQAPRFRRSHYDVGFDDDGRIDGHRARARLALRRDRRPVSPAINDRAMFHADNCYFLPAVEIVSHRLKTHTVSNTAFRGFGGPQGMMAIERVMDAIAAHLGLDPLAVRQRQSLRPGPRRDAVSHDGRGQCRAAADRRAGRARRLCRARARRSRRSTPATAC